MANDTIFNTVKHLDDSILTAINFDGPDAYGLFWKLYTDRLTWIPLAVVVLYCLMRRGGWRNALLLVLSLALMFMLSDFVVASVIKPLVARVRPSHATDLQDILSYYHGYRGGHYGFPSNHASNGFAAATLLMLLFRQRAITLCAFLWAAGSCYSRLYLGVHYPTDILVGAVLGISFALLAYYVYKQSYLYVSRRYSMPPFNHIHRDSHPWAILAVFALTVIGLAVYALLMT